MQYLKTPYLDNTTNKSESLHHEIEVYPSLKNGQKSEDLSARALAGDLQAALEDALRIIVIKKE